MNVKSAQIALFLLSFLLFTSCGSDDPSPSTPNEISTLADGWYIMGEGTAVTSGKLAFGLMQEGINEVGQVARPEMHTIFLPIKAGDKGFNLVHITSKTPTYYGPDEVVVVDSAARSLEADCIEFDFQRGTVKTSETKDSFTVPADGFYQIVYDEVLNTIAIVPIHFSIIGDVTPCDKKIDFFTESAFKLDTFSFVLEHEFLYSGSWKYQLSRGSKIMMGDGVAFNTTLGNSTSELKPGGTYITNMNEWEVAMYSSIVTWTLADGLSALFQKSADVYPEVYPSKLFVIGDATAHGWDSNSSNALMHRCTNNNEFTDGLFWKIVYLEADKAFKVTFPCWGNKTEFDFNEYEFDSEGVSVTQEQGGNGWTITQSGLYIVVVDMRGDLEKVSIKPAEVYGKGVAFGGWDFNVANKYTVGYDLRTLVSPKLLYSGSAVMYASHPWLPNLWNAQFQLLDSKIVYMNDGDFVLGYGEVNQVITLNFDDNSGSINYVACCGL